MTFTPSSRWLIVLLCFTPPFVTARGRGRGGGGSISIGGDSSFALQPTDAAIFAFCVIFAVITALQALQAARNMYRRLTNTPPSISTPQYSVGPIFPACLLMSPLCLTTAYALHGTFWGIMYNQERSDFFDPEFSNAFHGAWSAMAFFADNFLIAGLLAVLSHREKVLFSTTRAVRDIKRIVDAIVIVLLVALSMAALGLWQSARARPFTEREIAFKEGQTGDNLFLAYSVAALLAVLDIAISSIFLYLRSRRSSVKDNVGLLTALIISPLFIIYALYPVVKEGLLRNGVYELDRLNYNQWELAGVVIQFVTEAIIIQVCLVFGMPALPKQKKVTIHSYAIPEKAY